MEMWITWWALVSFVLLFSFYKIAQTILFQKAKSKLEQEGFLTANIVLFLEFILLLLHFLLAEIIVTGANELLLSRLLLWVACVLLLVFDDLVLFRKWKRK